MSDAGSSGGPPDWLADPTLRNVYSTITARNYPALDYESWIDAWFGGAITSSAYPWFADVPCVQCEPLTANEHARRLFENAAQDLKYFHDDQVGAGLWTMLSDDDIYLAWPDVPVDDREALLLGTTDLFRDLFAARCREGLNQQRDDTSALELSCYMWCEFAVHLAWPGDPATERMHDAAWRVMEETLAIPHAAVQESALHGLGHAASNDPERTAAIIDRWLALNSTIDPALRSYAEAARSGCIQ